MTVDPWCSSATNGIGGQGITLRIPDRASGASARIRAAPATDAGVAGRTSIPPVTSGTGCRR